MRTLFLLMSLMVTPLRSEQQGRASVELLVAHTEVQGGQQIPAAIRMVYEKDWHGYWINPGEGGMRTEVEWQLPDGWTAGPLQFPVPHRIVTGPLTSYGYEGEILLPFFLTAPAVLAGPQTIKGKVNWLACNQQNCVAGEASVEITLTAGKPQAGPHAVVIAAASAALPTVNPTLQMQVIQGAEGIDLKFTGAENLDLQNAQIFPVTEQSLDPHEAIVLKKSATGYEVRVRKNEYAAKELTGLLVVVVPKSPQRALWVEWKK